MRYQGIKRFKPDAQPHAQNCDCPACQQYAALIARINPERVTDAGTIRNAELRDKPTKGLTWNDPNRPYEIAQGNRSSALWRGGVLTQVRTAPQAQPVQAQPQAQPVQARVATRKPSRLSSREKRYQNRLERSRMASQKQIVTSVRVTPIQENKYRRNGQTIAQQTVTPDTRLNARGVVQLTCTPKTVSPVNAVTMVNR